MIILFDFSQVIIPSCIKYYNSTNDEITLSTLRSIILSTIISYKKNFDGVFIICFDNKNYWRKEIYDGYKSHRKTMRDKSKFDWDSFFKYFNIIKEEIKNLQFNSIEVEHCEADDIIASLCYYEKLDDQHKIIISSDKDLLQLENSKIKQWSPYHKKFITKKTNEYDLFFHVIRGDPGDGIPNIYNSSFSNKQKGGLLCGEKSKKIRSTKIDEWKNSGGFDNPKNFCHNDEIFSYYIRNKKLIDLKEIPEEYRKKIQLIFSELIAVSTLDKTEDCYNLKNKITLLDYIVQHKLKNLLDHII